MKTKFYIALLLGAISNTKASQSLNELQAQKDSLLQSLKDIDNQITSINVVNLAENDVPETELGKIDDTITIKAGETGVKATQYEYKKVEEQKIKDAENEVKQAENTLNKDIQNKEDENVINSDKDVVTKAQDLEETIQSETNVAEDIANQANSVATGDKKDLQNNKAKLNYDAAAQQLAEEKNKEALLKAKMEQDKAKDDFKGLEKDAGDLNKQEEKVANAQDITDKALEKLDNSRYHMIIFCLAVGSICFVIFGLYYVICKKEPSDMKNEGGQDDLYVMLH